ncbi:hypothetical protein ACWDSJ_35705 [Nocardia sp. NPDC003482]
MVHSRYRRTIVDLAVAGREVVIRLMMRQFRREAAHCERRIFSEQVQGWLLDISGAVRWRPTY